MTTEQERKLDYLYNLVMAIQRGEDVPTIESINEHANVRLSVGSSAKTVASASRTVTEAGSSTYLVQLPPDGFVTLDGLDGKNFPFFFN